MVDPELERQKWDRLAADWPEYPPAQDALADELAAVLRGLDPSITRVLEAGCGSGLTSVGLARRGFEVDLLDFSAPMLASAGRAWDAHGPGGRRPQLLQADLFDAAPEALGVEPYDCVFNAGLLEHYDDDEIVRLLESMARLSRRWVVALVPNSRCAAYRWWKWHHLRQGTWTFGRELPRSSLAEPFARAGLSTVVELPLAAEWSADFVEQLAAVAPPIAEWLRDDELPAELSGYLLCSVGRLAGDEAAAEREPSAARAFRALWEQARRASGDAADAALAARGDAERARSHAAQAEAEAAAARERADALRRELAGTQQQLAAATDPLAPLPAGTRAIVDEFEAARERRARRLHAELALRQRAGRDAELRSGALSNRVRELERDLSVAVSRAGAIEAQLEQLAESKTIRMLGLVRQLGPRLGRGRIGDRLRFLGQVARRAVGRGAPIEGETVLGAASRAMRELLSGLRVPDDAAAAAPLPPPFDPDPDAVYIVSSLFLDRTGTQYLFGGAERYHLELAKVIAELGRRPVICQAADFDWHRDFQGIDVVGIRAGLDPVELSVEFHRRMPSGASTIYSSFFLAASASHPNALGISHGVFWDHPSFQGPGAREHWTQVLNAAIDHCRHLVSVDANTINQVRATGAHRADKWTRVPNFVDLDEFHPPAARPADRQVVLYPRRLYAPRGFWLVAEIVPAILARFPEAEFWFVGQAEARELAAVEELRQRFPGRVRHSTLQPDAMPDAYRAASITLIPTVNSEGTSLSCLEAMATANAVIATDVGGLAELVVDDFNGLLVSPDAAALRDALERLLASRELRERLGSNARASAVAFGLDSWRARWRRLLTELLPARAAPAAASLPLTWLHPRTPGIQWGSMKQRPHHLMEALARAGEDAVFVCDGPVSATTTSSGLRVASDERTPPGRQRVLYVYYAYHEARTRDERDAIVVYDVLDDPAIHAASDATLPPGTPTFLDHHERLVASADVLVTSSRRLAAEFRAQRPDVRLIPNGVWPEHFATPRARPLDLPPEGRPIAGYYGAIAEWFDYELIRGCAQLLPHFWFVLVGPATDPAALATLTALPNVLHLGEKPYEELPAYAGHFDVGIVPFVVNPVTDAVSPLKLFEYAAAGTPIVATGFQEALDAGPTFVGDGLLDFADQLRRAAEHRRDPERIAELRAFAAANAWSERARALQAAVEAARRRRQARTAQAAVSAG